MNTETVKTYPINFSKAADFIVGMQCYIERALCALQDVAEDGFGRTEESQREEHFLDLATRYDEYRVKLDIAFDYLIKLRDSADAADAYLDEHYSDKNQGERFIPE